MKYLLSVLIFLLWTNSCLAQLSLPEQRQFYLEAGENSDDSDQFLAYMDKTDHQTPLMLAYYASAQAFLSKHAKWTVTKLKYIKLADKSFEQAIVMDSLDAEVRFLRFAVQHNIPKFLGLINQSIK